MVPFFLYVQGSDILTLRRGSLFSSQYAVPGPGCQTQHMSLWLDLAGRGRMLPSLAFVPLVDTTKTQRLIGFWLHLENVFADFEFAVAATSLQNGEVTWGLLTFLVADLHGRSEGPAWLIDILLPLARMGGKVQ